jgi:AcrR family transcriptional regulator
VRASVHAAALDLLREHPDPTAITITAIAERSGVHQATLYRRWGTITALLLDVAAELLSRQSPVPDTGTLRGDLEAFAVTAAHDLTQPLAPALLRALIFSNADDRQRDPDLTFPQRVGQLQAMLDRATARGEHPPTLNELLEVLLAPMYFHLLFRNRPPDAHHARTLVDRLLASTQPDARGVNGFADQQ